jgi:(p)ppGpp synthase/HD superfamily hydrolase
MIRMQSDMIQIAKHGATIAHEGQFRKGTGAPYVTHPIAVAEAVRVRGGDDFAIAAAYLHDVLEDTDFTSKDLLEIFCLPREVVDIVIELTDVFTHESFPHLGRAKRKEMETKRLAGISDRAKLVKICDIEDNDKTIELVGGPFAKIWRDEKKDLLKVLI